jgi:hypothetical protein
MIAAVGAHGLAREQATHGVEPLLERRRPVLQVGAHGVELLGAVTDAALEDEASLGDGRERADLLGDEHGLPERQEEQTPRGGVAPLGEQPAEHRHVLVVRGARRVMVAQEQRVEAGPPRRRGPLDHHARAPPRVRCRVGARQRDADFHDHPVLHAAGVKRVPPSSRTM